MATSRRSVLVPGTMDDPHAAPAQLVQQLERAQRSRGHAGPAEVRSSARIRIDVAGGRPLLEDRRSTPGA